jgi:hypothetical protein
MTIGGLITLERSDRCCCNVTRVILTDNQALPLLIQVPVFDCC